MRRFLRTQLSLYRRTSRIFQLIESVNTHNSRTDNIRNTSHKPWQERWTAFSFTQRPNRIYPDRGLKILQSPKCVSLHSKVISFGNVSGHIDKKGDIKASCFIQKASCSHLSSSLNQEAGHISSMSRLNNHWSLHQRLIR